MQKVTYISKALAILFITSILIISGCKNKKSTTPDSNAATASSANPAGRRALNNMLNLLKLPDANEVAVTVNGVEIKEGAIQEIIKPEIDNVKNALQISTEPLPEDAMITQFMEEIRQKALMQLVREELLKEQVKDVNIVISDDEADQYFKKQLEQANVDWEKFQEVMKEKNVSYQEIIDDTKKELTYVKYIVSKMNDSEKITEEDAKEFYDKNKSRFIIPEQVRASHILVPVSKNEPNDVKQKARAKIEDMLRQIKEGADFAELAKDNPDSTALTGGDLDYFSRGMMVTEFEKPAFELEPNQVSDVIETVFGYHLIKVTDHKDEETISFDEVKDKLIESLKNQNEDEFIRNYIESLVKNADLKFPKGKEIKIEESN